MLAARSLHADIAVLPFSENGFGRQAAHSSPGRASASA
jgi:hypothetical protein